MFASVIRDCSMRYFFKHTRSLYVKLFERGGGVVRFVDISGLVHSGSYNLNLNVEDLMMPAEPDIKYGIQKKKKKKTEKKTNTAVRTSHVIIPLSLIT